MTEPKYDKYIGYKTNILTLIVGILIGILTNYIAFFFPANYVGLVLSILGICVIFFFFISRYRSPRFSVFEKFPEGFVKGKPKDDFISSDPYKKLFERFIYRANLDISQFWETLFKPFIPLFLTRARIMSVFSNFSIAPRFLPLSENQHTKEIDKISKTLSSLSRDERSTLKDSVFYKYHRISFRFVTGRIFEYRSISNRLLRGKGVFYVRIHDKPGIGCIIIPSISCVASRHYEEYHASLCDKLAEVLKSLMKDRKFKRVVLDQYG